MVRGMEVDCGNLTMLDYLKGYERDEGIFFPNAIALNDMLHDPIIDVRASMVWGPRVETRAHDCVSSQVSVALDAMYRGVDQRLDQVQDLMRGMTGREIQRQRIQACWHGLATPVAHVDDTIKTQQDIARRVLEIAAEGLRERYLLGLSPKGDERVLLTPLQQIANTGINPAQEMLALWAACGDDTLKFFDQIRYGRSGLNKSPVPAFAAAAAG
jgi:gamma-glutamylcysteine synthetase